MFKSSIDRLALKIYKENQKKKKNAEIKFKFIRKQLTSLLRSCQDTGRYGCTKKKNK